MNTEKKYYVVYKPFNTLSRFKPFPGKRTLAELYDFPKDAYPVGRLDEDSEGLLLITNDKKMNYFLLHPKFSHRRTYLVMVDGVPTEEDLDLMRNGLEIRIKKKIHHSLPCEAQLVDKPEGLPERDPPPVLFHNKKYSWLSITLTEGKFRQVRRMTAKIGFPTIRLIRSHIEKLSLGDMQPGEVREIGKFTLFRKIYHYR